MGQIAGARHLRIGVDVGGTNTDGVILDLSRASEPDKGIIAWHKAPTTGNPSFGINNAITTMLQSSKVNPDDVVSVTIGTTHFVNAVVEMDMSRLTRVAIIRLCSGFSKHAPPGVDWPDHMRSSICAHYALVKGGLQVDGDLIDDIDEEEIRKECEIIKQKGITSVVVVGVFSPIDTIYQQEERAGEIVKSILPGCDLVLSKDVANLGFLERENAAILNASILPFARKTIKSFQEPIRRLGLHCPVFITQNDGTVLSGEAASRLPIRTFSSGPTNSMRGAAFLVKNEIEEAMMVVDIGGTTTDVGLLLANGFPRQAAAFSELSGVRMNFSRPDVKSIGLGGGSIVRIRGGKVTVGPESVGYKIQTEALVFGGSVPTSTDYIVASDSSLDIGDRSLLHNKLPETEIVEVKKVIKQMLERIIDTMKTSPLDIPVILVGGGAVIAPDKLEGASRVLKPQWSGVANAIGAAMARVSETIDTVRSTEGTTTKEQLKRICELCIDKTVEAGAIRDSVRVVEMDTFPLQYIANKSRFVVRAAGDFDFSRSIPDISLPETDKEEKNKMSEYEKKADLKPEKFLEQSENDPIEIDITSYRPNVKDRVWYVSKTDVDLISIGCYILGTGGGGTPYSHMVRLHEILKEGGVVRVINPHDLKDDALVGGGGGAGSPTVSIEKLQGDEMMESQIKLYEYMGIKPDAMISLEIGGGNGLQGMILGASTNMDVPAVDGDWMGRAYPTRWQITPYVFVEKGAAILPITVADGSGNIMYITEAKDDVTTERIIRASLSQLGSHVACADGPVSGLNTKKWAVEHTISLSWRIGRAVVQARQSNRIDNVAEAIVEEVGGTETAKVLFKGKIIGVERTLRMGHVYGEVTIEGMGSFQGKIKIPFKNENIAVFQVDDGGNGTGVLAVVPDLIAVVDAQNGEAIGTPEYRFGLLVSIIGITASNKWTSTQRGIDIGGPKAFGLDIKYEPLGVYKEPKSVIDEYNTASS
ncbi:hypothetical protein F5884DRAFT_675835 [Xylogone sp. PMI_703]|nr:hypothetical protein F5884DRAFT_675835 [Xylogone sp. PMI_703]